MSDSSTYHTNLLKLDTLLTRKAMKGLKYTYKYYPAETHMTELCLPIMMPYGLFIKTGKKKINDQPAHGSMIAAILFIGEGASFLHAVIGTHYFLLLPGCPDATISYNSTAYVRRRDQQRIRN